MIARTVTQEGLKQDDDCLTQALHYAQGLLARREHSQLELLRKLMLKGFSKALAENVITKLEHCGLQSDTRFASCYFEMRCKRGIGPFRIKRELCERGISQQACEGLFQSNQVDWLGSAHRVREKKFGDSPPINSRERQRQAQFLQYRGFLRSHIAQVIDDLELD